AGPPRQPPGPAKIFPIWPLRFPGPIPGRAHRLGFPLLGGDHDFCSLTPRSASRIPRDRGRAVGAPLPGTSGLARTVGAPLAGVAGSSASDPDFGRLDFAGAELPVVPPAVVCPARLDGTARPRTVRAATPAVGVAQRRPQRPRPGPPVPGRP